MDLRTLSGITRVSQYQNQSGFYWSKRQWVVVTSVGPYASLHLTPDKHASTPPLSFFYSLDALPAAQPKASKHRRKTNYICGTWVIMKQQDNKMRQYTQWHQTRQWSHHTTVVDCRCCTRCRETSSASSLDPLSTQTPDNIQHSVTNANIINTIQHVCRSNIFYMLESVAVMYALSWNFISIVTRSFVDSVAR